MRPRIETGSTARFALALVWAIVTAVAIVSAAQAACTAPVASRLGLWRLATAGPEGMVSITFLGHASFLIESPTGVRIVTDYNDVIRAPVTPDIVTMNNAHPTHYSEAVEPGVKYILRGWDPDGRVASHRFEYRDVRIHNVPTNVRELGGTRYNGNSIFVFDIADLCIAHLGHLHHTLTPAHLAELGAIDVVMVPIDGVWTLNQDEMIEVLQQIKPKLVIPMHIFTHATLDKFLTRIGDLYRVRHATSSTIALARSQLPEKPELVVLPGE
jgi:L-ascorbate metabolism protein UlaG (beta-lactamase superfamily)